MGLRIAHQVANPEVGNPDVGNPEVGNPEVGNPEGILLLLLSHGRYYYVCWIFFCLQPLC